MECKSKKRSKSNGINKELIDTLWNVNSFHISWYKKAMGINRYIMECKLYSSTMYFKNPLGINRYIMECKFSHVWHRLH